MRPTASAGRPGAAPTPQDAASQGPGGVRVIPVTGIAEVRAGDDLSALLPAALRAAGIRDGDVLCVSTKIVSKSLGLRVEPEAREAAVRAASVRTVARRLHTRVVTSVVQIPSGPVMAAAGVDTSNAPDGPLLLPDDPDACAAQLRTGLNAALGLDLGVILSDTSSRIWRVGVGDIALGAAGVDSLQDLRGGGDDTGRPLAVTVRNLADELAAAADLVKGKADRVPVAIVRGVRDAVTASGTPARALSRTGGEDWFRRPSLESVWEALGVPAAQEPIARMSPEPAPERIARALEVAGIARAGTSALRARALATDAGHVAVTPAGDDPAAWADAGVLAERVRTALGAEAIAAALPEVRVEIAPPSPVATGPAGSALPSSPDPAPQQEDRP